MNRRSIEDQVLAKREIAVHVFSVSAAMVGVCITVIGLVKVGGQLQQTSTFLDEAVAVNAILFLTSCLLSYLGLRIVDLRWSRRSERAAETIFIVGLLVMVVICGLLARTFLEIR